jgi:protein-S-isoprenylcysteine O-methyltransferase Ste14
MIQLLTPHDPAAAVIALCWLVFGIVWAVSALFVKRTIEQSLGWVHLVVFALAIAAVRSVSYRAGLRHLLWPGTALLGALAASITVAGLVVTVWARAILGRNWSGTVAFKEGHELIERGPYAYVRHPIYSGLLLMGLGTAIERARLESFLILATALVGLAIKAQFEERLMIRHFPEKYPQYRRRVKALIPGVW